MPEIIFRTFHRNAVRAIRDVLIFQRVSKISGHIFQQDAVLRTLRPSKARPHIHQIEREGRCKNGIRAGFCAEHPLGFCIFFDQLNTRFLATGGREIGHTFFIDREEAACGAIFGCHIGNRCLIFQRQVIETRTIKFNKFTNHTFLAKHLHNGQHQIGCRGSFRQLAR